MHLLYDNTPCIIIVQVALVGQEPVLYARSVTENVGYGLDTYTNEQVQTVRPKRVVNAMKLLNSLMSQSAKLANAHGFIMDTTDGYNTNVGEKGSQMSGRQIQALSGPLGPLL